MNSPWRFPPIPKCSLGPDEDSYINGDNLSLQRGSVWNCFKVIFDLFWFTSHFHLTHYFFYRKTVEQESPKWLPFGRKLNMQVSRLPARSADGCLNAVEIGRNDCRKPLFPLSPVTNCQFCFYCCGLIIGRICCLLWCFVAFNVSV